MDIRNRAADLLRQTEAKLRGIVSEAAASGDYASVVRVAAWASSIRDMMNGCSDNERVERPRSANNDPKVKTARRLSVPDNRRSYPRFFRHGDELIRLAWSKREKKEYRHKTSYGRLKSLAIAVAEKGTDGRVFSTDEFLPLHDPTDGTEIPSYQAYVCISLLKDAGLLEQHGRQGYSISQGANFSDAVEDAWKNLPRR